MADDSSKKTPIDIDDWDSLPLDPESSWDAVPAPEGEAAGEEFGEAALDAFGEETPGEEEPEDSLEEPRLFDLDDQGEDPLSPDSSGRFSAEDTFSRETPGGFGAEDSFTGESPEDSFDITVAEGNPPLAYESGKGVGTDDLDGKGGTDGVASGFSEEPAPESPGSSSSLLVDVPGAGSKEAFGGRLSGDDLLDFPQRRGGGLELDEEGVSEGLSEKPGGEEFGSEDSWDAVVPDGGTGGGDDSWDESPAEKALSPAGGETDKDKDIGKGKGKDKDIGKDIGKEEESLKKEAKSGRDAKPDPEIGEPDKDVDRTRFLESLLEDGEKVPRKVELDLDGIFTQAKEEAEQLSPDSTHTPLTPPLPPMEKDHETPAPPPEPLSEPKVRKVSKFKLLFLLIPIVVGALGLFIGVYEIFIKSPPKVEVPLIVLDPDAKRDLIPGELTLDSFNFTLEGTPDDPGPAVTELEIILHYHDVDDLSLINRNLVTLRDMIFRIAKSNGKTLLTDPNLRRKLQADLLSTLNELPFLKDHVGADGETARVLTYVQISKLRRINS